MSVIVFDDYLNEGADMTRTGFFPGLFDNAASNVSAFGFDITMTIGGDTVLVSFTGEGLDIVQSGDLITGIVGGTITGFAQFNNTASVYGIGSLAYDAAGFFAFVEAGDKTAQLTLLTGGDDVVLGNYARDGDVLLGRGGRDTLNGNDGADTLNGGTGRDVLQGDAGDDSLNGGKSRDLLLGGKGADSFVFDQAPLARNADVIRGFTAGLDKVALSSAIFDQAGGVGALAEAVFHAGTVAAEADDRIIFDAGTGEIWYDADGSEAGAMRLIARMAEGVVVTFGDIEVF